MSNRGLIVLLLGAVWLGEKIGKMKGYVEVLKDADEIMQEETEKRRTKRREDPGSYGDYHRWERTTAWEGERIFPDYRPVFDTESKALDVLGDLIDLSKLRKYGAVTIGDLYRTMGKTPCADTENYGWYGLEDAHVVVVDDGFMIRFKKPDPMP